MDPSVFPDEPDDRLPDLILGGAMKSGTSTLEHLLGQHPKIDLAQGFTGFFNLDNFAQHRDFYPQEKGDWVYHDLESDFQTYYEWYCSFFKDIPADTLAGETTQIYLSSSRVPKRIKRVLPDVKLIFLLRDPVDRTYSHYWHRFRTGKVIFNFDRTIKYAPDGLLRRSFYLEQLQRYFDLFSSDQIKVILFERFIEEMDTVLNELFEFLGLDNPLDLEELDTHRHKAKAPRSVTLQVWLNYLFRDLNTNRYADQLPNMPESKSFPFQKAIYRSFSSLNLTRKKDVPPMNQSTRDFLGKVLSRENRGLDELLDRNLGQYWRSF